MAAKFVSPYRMAGKSGKNDAADAQAICEAVCRPHMRFVPVKDESQQAMRCLHRTVRDLLKKTATYNRLRGLISEFGVIAPQSTDALRHMVSAQNSLPLQVQQCVDDLLEHVARIEANIAEYDRILFRMAKTDHRRSVSTTGKSDPPRHHQRFNIDPPCLLRISFSDNPGLSFLLQSIAFPFYLHDV
ncbi:Putative transposase (identified by ISEscan HMM) [Klebsiella variicola]|nr:Putative transposase (identified by ISEscan HMM) [Klebsiella variicola]